MMPVNLPFLLCVVLALIQQPHLQVGLCISPCKGQILQHGFFKGPSFSPISHFLTLGDYLAFRVGVWVVTTLKSKAR